MFSRALPLVLASCLAACQTTSMPSTPAASLDEPSGLEEVAIQSLGLE